jgi:hypothetical protein
MYREGDWIIDKVHGQLGNVLHVYPDGVTAKFGGMTCLRGNHNIELAPTDIQAEDLLAMQHVAVETGDYDWFCQLGKRMEVETLG